MREAAAREVLLVQAFDTAQPPSPLWTDDDRAWATRLAAAAAPGDDRSADAFVAGRARHALQRLGPRAPELTRWLARPAWRSGRVAAVVLAAAAGGLLSDGYGGTQRIDLLAPPLWGVLAWNAVVYLLLLGASLKSLAGSARRPGLLTRTAERLGALGRRLPRLDAAAGGAAVLAAFAGRWGRLAAPLAAVRATAVLHAAAAAVGAGLVAGLYLRGLVFDYRAGWQSTFLSAEAVRAGLGVLLAPASALSGIALPDAAGYAALRQVPGDTGAGAPAAPWIHLLALTLLLFVVLPRSLLAALAAGRAAYRSRHLALPLDEPYFQQLLRAGRGGGAARVAVVPYAVALGAQAALALRAVLVRALGDPLDLRIAPTQPFGAEDRPADAAPLLPTGSTLAVLLFDLTATPEADHHGRFVARLAAEAGPAVTVVLLVDEAGFVRRFRAAGARLDERRAAWRRFAEGPPAAPLVFVNLDAPDAGAAGVDATAAAWRRALGGAAV